MPSDPWSTLATRKLADHEIHLFYECDGIALEGSATTAGDLIGETADCFPADQSAALLGRYRAQRVWEPTRVEVGRDLHSHVRALAAGSRPDLAATFAPTAQIRRLIEHADLYEENTPAGERVSKRLRLTFGKRAAERLKAEGIAPEPLAVTVVSTVLHVFATGKSFVHVTIALARVSDGAPPAALELLEALLSLSRYHALTWATADGQPIEPAAPFGLGLLVRRLAIGREAEAAPVVAERVSTYTYAQLAEVVHPEEAELLSWHLARHYSVDYVREPSSAGVERIRDFETVTHAVALEGAATIVAATSSSDELPGFLKDFKTGTFRLHYIPIALLAIHEHAFLVDRTSRSVLSFDEQKDIEATLHGLARLRSDSLAFRVCYRFSEVSRITMHNALNRAYRHALGLDRLLQEFAGDVSEIEAYLRGVEEARARSRFHWVTLVGGAALAGLTAFTIIKETTEVVLGIRGVAHWFTALLGLPLNGHQLDLIAGVAGVAAGLFVATAAWLIGRWRRPSGPAHGHGEMTMHAMIEHMLHTAKK
jgi:hypothetical protein